MRISQSRCRAGRKFARRGKSKQPTFHKWQTLSSIRQIWPFFHNRPLEIRGRHIRSAAKLDYTRNVVPHGINSQWYANSMSQERQRILLAIQLGAQGLRRPLTPQRRNLSAQHTCREGALATCDAHFNIRCVLDFADSPISKFESRNRGIGNRFLQSPSFRK